MTSRLETPQPAVHKKPCDATARTNEKSTFAPATAKGKRDIPIEEGRQAAIEETLYLNSMPGMAVSLAVGKTERVADCVSENSLEW